MCRKKRRVLLIGEGLKIESTEDQCSCNSGDIKIGTTVHRQEKDWRDNLRG